MGPGLGQALPLGSFPNLPIFTPIMALLNLALVLVPGVPRRWCLPLT